MPELPEVETVVRSIAPKITGKTIRHISLSSKRVTRGGLPETTAALQGRTIERVRRHGKQIFFHLDRGVVYVHLGMTGKLLWNGERTPYTRAEFTFDHGMLLYDDVRQFGRVEYYQELPKRIEGVGPDALSISFDDFYARLKQHRTAIKPLLLNQSFIAGVGNIYADEALWRARTHWAKEASSLRRADAGRILAAVREVLAEALQAGGTSFDSLYVNVNGESGYFGRSLAVYGREGEPCPRCGAPVRRDPFMNRSSYTCPVCQPRPRSRRGGRDLRSRST